MYNDRITLSSSEILEKEFKIDARGYRLQEVDKFLDIIIHDYNEYNSIIKELAINNNKLLEENEELKTEIRTLKSNMEALRIAFTQIISGRAPEQRGNGLKFVLNYVVQIQWVMYFQSGDAYCLIDKSGYSFGSASQNYNGCFCILRRK